MLDAISGLYVVAQTPFTADGAVDLESIDTLSEFYYRHGAQGLSQSARSGTRMVSMIMANSAPTNGRAPTIRSSIDPRRRTPCTTNRLMPTGGVISAVSISKTTMIPNHTGS